jgi:hypothetical protein
VQLLCNMGDIYRGFNGLCKEKQDINQAICR